MSKCSTPALFYAAFSSLFESTQNSHWCLLPTSMEKQVDRDLRLPVPNNYGSNITAHPVPANVQRLLSRVIPIL